MNILIPEYVSVYTSACFNKKNNKTYILNEASFEYRSIPKDAFSYGITFLTNEANIKYKIAMNITFMDELLNEKANN